jgi:hypothetical protein
MSHLCSHAAPLIDAHAGRWVVAQAGAVWITKNKRHTCCLSFFRMPCTDGSYTTPSRRLPLLAIKDIHSSTADNTPASERMSSDGCPCLWRSLAGRVIALPSSPSPKRQSRQRPESPAYSREEPDVCEGRGHAVEPPILQPAHNTPSNKRGHRGTHDAKTMAVLCPPLPLFTPAPRIPQRHSLGHTVHLCIIPVLTEH